MELTVPVENVSENQVQCQTQDDTPVIHQLNSVNCPIERVIVYPDRAEITRKVPVLINKTGLNNIVISGFSLKMNQNSIRVEVGEGRATILEVSYALVIPDYVPPSEKEVVVEKKQKEFLEKIEALEKKKENFNLKLQSLEAEETWLHAYSNTKLQPSKIYKEKGHIYHMLSTEEAQEVMQAYRQNLTRLCDKKFEVQKEINEIKKEISTIQSQINQKKEISEQRREVTIEISVKEPGSVVLKLCYVVMSASWTSSYEVRVDPEKETCNLIYYGVITNTTGEDWNEVSLALSTAEPSLGGVPPSLSPVHIQFDPPGTGSSVGSGSDSGSDDSAASEEEELSGSGSNSDHSRSPILKKKNRNRRLSLIARSPPSKEKKVSKNRAVSALTTQVEESGTSATYHIRRQATIPSDGKPHKVTVMQENLVAAFSYVAVPTRTSQAYLKAVATNSTTYYLMPGNMNVFINNFFVALSKLNATNPKEVFKLYLGVDDSIKVDFQPIQFNEVTSGGGPFSKKVKTDTTTHTTIIKNLKKKPINILVFDQKPFTTNTNDIKIKIEEPKANNTTVESDEYSLISWDLKLGPGEETIVVFKYSIEYPTEKMLVLTEQKGVKGVMRL